MKKRNEDEPDPLNEPGLTDHPPAQGGDDQQGAPAAGDVTAVTAERDQLREQLQRTLADLQNIRRQTRKQIEDSRAVTIAQVIKEFLPVLDNLERASAAGGDPKDVQQGLQLVLALFRGLLERSGVQRISDVGEQFDPMWHEAVQVETRTDLPSRTILEDIEPGYRMGDRLLRVARVKVSQSPEETGASGAQGERDGGRRHGEGG